MARAGKSQQAVRRSSGGGFLLGMFFGVVIGLAVALGVAFYLNKTPIPFASQDRPAERDAASAGAGAKSAIAGLPTGTATLPPPADAPKPGEKPKFDFYKILPGGDDGGADRAAKRAPVEARVPHRLGSDTYFVQAGAFQNPADADNLKAKLAIAGLESNVEPTEVAGKGTWYRVRLGPYTELEDLNRIRQTLAQNGFSAELIRLRGDRTQKR